MTMTYTELKKHIGHDIECVEYANALNVSVECNTCSEVLFDYDEPYFGD